MPANSRPCLEPLWEAAKQSGEEGFQAIQHTTCLRLGDCVTQLGEKRHPLPWGSHKRACGGAGTCRSPELGCPPHPACFDLSHLFPALRLVCPYQTRATTRSQRRPPAVGYECLPPPKGLMDLSDTCKSSCGVFLEQSEHACILAVLCQWDCIATPTFTCSGPTLMRWKN